MFPYSQLTPLRLRAGEEISNALVVDFKVAAKSNKNKLLSFYSPLEAFYFRNDKNKLLLYDTMK